MVSRKQEGNFHWYSAGISTEEQLLELPHHSPCNGYPPHSSQCITNRASNLSNSKALMLSWPHVSSLTYGFRKDRWLRDPSQKLSLQETQQTGWSLLWSSFHARCIFPAFLASFIQNFLPSWISPMLSPASCLTFILPHFHWICLFLSCVCPYQLAKGFIYCAFCKPWVWTPRLSLQLCLPIWAASSGGKNMHSVLVQHRKEHGPSSTFTQINYHISFQSVPELSVIYNIQLLWGSQSHVTQISVPEQTFTLPEQRPSLEVLDSGCYSWDTISIWEQVWHQKSLSSSIRADSSAGEWEHTMLWHFKIWWTPSEDIGVT